MKFQLTSDTHGFYPDIPKGDVFIHAGDFSSARGSMAQLKMFTEWVEAAPCRHKIVIAGNHDFELDKHKWLAKKILAMHDIIYLEDSGAYIGGVNSSHRLYVYGSPWHPKIWGKFELERTDLPAVWDLIPEYTDILVTHGPPLNILDRTDGNDNEGDSALQDAVKRVQPKLHVFGHIHEGCGVLPWREDYPTISINASFCDTDYHPRNEIIEIDVPYVTDT